MQRVERAPLDSEIQGQYLALLKPVNHFLIPNLRGAATFSREENEIVGDVSLRNAFPDLVYGQSIREGKRCPTKEDDTNQDGYIDAKEGEVVYGRILVPLDGDLNTQASMARVFPLANQYGNYIYSKVASFESFMRDLREEDPSDEDDYVKLSQNEELGFQNRVVIIQGIPKDLELPSTVESVRGQTRYQTFPIACGKIKKVKVSPGIDESSRPLRSAESVSPEDILSGGF